LAQEKAYLDVKSKFNVETIARKYAAMIEGALNDDMDRWILATPGVTGTLAYIILQAP
jgi:hypothetical protein